VRPFFAPLGLAVLAFGAPARGDLTDDAARVAKLWSEAGGEVDRLPAVFVEHGRAQRLTFADAHDAKPGCLTVALLAVRTAEFQVHPVLPPGTHDTSADHSAVPALAAADGEAGRERSVGGAALLSRCGAARADLARVDIEIASGRAAVEVVVARSEAGVAPLSRVLPERDVGPVAPHGDPGGPLEPGPLAVRVARAERRARADGAEHVERHVVRADGSGVGRAQLQLREGCHRVDVMAEVPSSFPHRTTDIDAEARDAAARLLARDAADVPDARLDFCLGEPGAVTIPFVGAAGAMPVTLSAARWPISARVPTRWGSRARAGFAAALFKRRAPEPRAEPILESLGVQGQTSVPLEVVPGRCYLAALAPLRGEARSMRLSAAVGDRMVRDETSERPEGVALSFCAERSTVARFDADVRGNFAWWALAVWPMGSVAP
jgi:hypothetical protein